MNVWDRLVLGMAVLGACIGVVIFFFSIGWVIYDIFGTDVIKVVPIVLGFLIISYVIGTVIYELT